MNLLTACVTARRAATADGETRAVIHSYFHRNYYVIRYADLYSIANFDTIRYII